MALRQPEPNFLGTSGHVGHFNEYDRELLPVPKHPGCIRFYGMNLLSLVYFKRTSNESFTLFGPWYSMLFETAKKLNYSMEGLQTKEGSREDEIISDFNAFQPDIVFIPFSPRVDVQIRFYEFGVVKVSNIVFTVESDHILSAVKYQTRNLMSILAPFDFNSLVLLFLGLICFLLFFGHLKQKPTKTTLTDFIWHLSTALIYCPQIKTRKNIWRLSGICWSLGVYLLQHLFAGEMYTSMTLAPELDVIDELEDLAQKSSDPITFFAEIDTDVNNYFSPNQTHRKELSKRLEILALDKMYSLDVAVELINNVTSGRQYHIGRGDLLEYYRKTLCDGLFKESLYISKEFGYPEPRFIPINSKIEPLVLQTFNKM